MVKVAGLSALWAAFYAGLFYGKAWQSGKENWSWAKFWTSVLLAAFLGFGSSLMNQTPDQFWDLLKDSGLGTFVMIFFENAGKLVGRGMRGVPPEKPKKKKGDAPAPTPADDAGGDPKPDGGDAAADDEDPETIVADALKPLKPKPEG